MNMPEEIGVAALVGSKPITVAILEEVQRIYGAIIAVDTCLDELRDIAIEQRDVLTRIAESIDRAQQVDETMADFTRMLVNTSPDAQSASVASEPAPSGFLDYRSGAGAVEFEVRDATTGDWREPSWYETRQIRELIRQRQAR